MKKLVMLLMLMAGSTWAANEQAVTINLVGKTPPALSAYEGNTKTFRVTFYNGSNVTTIATNYAPVMWWAEYPGATSIVMAVSNVVNSTNGIVDFTFSASKLAYDGGLKKGVYGVGIDDGTKLTFQLGSWTILEDPWAAGGGVTEWTSPVNLSLYTFSGVMAGAVISNSTYYGTFTGNGAGLTNLSTAGLGLGGLSKSNSVLLVDVTDHGSLAHSNTILRVDVTDLGTIAGRGSNDYQLAFTALPWSIITNAPAFGYGDMTSNDFVTGNGVVSTAAVAQVLQGAGTLVTSNSVLLVNVADHGDLAHSNTILRVDVTDLGTIAGRGSNDYQLAFTALPWTIITNAPAFGYGDMTSNDFVTGNGVVKTASVAQALQGAGYLAKSNTILRVDVTDFESGLWPRASITNAWSYNLTTVSNATVVTTTNGNAITFEVNGTGSGGAAPAYTNWTFSTVSNAVIVSTTNGTTINTEINGTGGGGAVSYGTSDSTAYRGDWGLALTNWIKATTSSTNMEPSFSSGASTNTWDTTQQHQLSLLMTNDLSDHATNLLTIGSGATSQSALRHMVVRVKQTDSMGVKRYYIKVLNCLTPSGVNLLYLGDGLVETSHVYQVHWDGETNRLINAAYFFGIGE